MSQATENPAGLDGFAFVEFATPDPASMTALFRRLGFCEEARHEDCDIRLFRQGGIIFLLNDEPGSHARDFAKKHGPCASAMGFQVADADAALSHAVSNGAEEASHTDGPLPVPAIKGIGGSRIYFVEAAMAGGLYPGYELVNRGEKESSGTGQAGLTVIDHLTHNVDKGRMDEWADFYTRTFNFHEIRTFDIEGKATGLVSRAMASPCGKICIPINESKDDQSQIAEYLEEYKGEGIQHIALATPDIYDSVRRLNQNGVAFQETPDTYYEMLEKRIPGHGERTGELKELGILLDGERNSTVGLLLQIFTKNVIGPIFFEIIQRKGNKGFGEGNFTALFESIELDQIRRGRIKTDA